MDIADEFRGYAQQCRDMARAAKDRESRATWNGLAERWLKCVEMEEAHRRHHAPAARSRRQRTYGRAVLQHAS